MSGETISGGAIAAIVLGTLLVLLVALAYVLACCGYGGWRRWGFLSGLWFYPGRRGRA